MGVVESADGTTWRPPVRFRITVIITMAVFSAVTGFLVWGH
jgi:hypothetical protein